MKHLLILAWLALFPVSGFSQSREAVDFWKKAISKMSFEDVVMEITSPSAPHWPVIVSPYAVEQLSGTQKNSGLDCLYIGEQLQRKFSERFYRVAQPDYAQIEAEIRQYGSILSVLDHVGGYGNALLEDSLLRLAVFRISGWCVQYPEDISGVNKLLEMINIPEINAKALLVQFENQDAVVQKRSKEIRKLKDSANFFEICDSLGVDFTLAIDPQRLCTTCLLKESSVAGLIYRMALTESFVKVNLKGSLHFFELGGKQSELDPKDIRPFETRMGSAVDMYTYPFLQNRRLKVTDIMMLQAVSRVSEIQSAWLGMALR